jgi:hypothetical protein
MNKKKWKFLLDSKNMESVNKVLSYSKNSMPPIKKLLISKCMKYFLTNKRNEDWI